MTERSTTNRTDNLAARAGRWSARHRKKAIFGWLAFVILAVVIGGSVGTRTLTDEEYGMGESGRAGEHEVPLLLGPLAQLAQEPGLADPRVAGDGQAGEAVVVERVKRRSELLELGLPADEW